ncbi:MAG: hypothetical protein KIT10_05595 [Flavobacteriales bacterium]|nr:hypothetical protein [Flavobacteriales bacterium]
MRLTSLALLLAVPVSLAAQNVGINANGAAPAASAMLDIDVTALPANAKQGMLVPRIALTATNVAAPVVAPAQSLLVFNTNTAGAGLTGVSPGYYYWDGAQWVRFAQDGVAWQLLGNAGTAPATNFIGTTDNVDFVTRTNNLERVRVIGNTGRVGIGVTVPLAMLEVSSGPIADGIFGHSNNVGGYLGRETNIVFGTPAQTLQGAGVYANNPTAGYTSTFSQSTGAATVAANISFSDVWIANYNYVQNNTATFNPPGIYAQLNVTSAVLGGYQIASRGYSNRAATAGNPGYTVGVDGVANAQNQDAFGVTGFAFTNTTTRAGGYFESFTYAGLSQAFAYVGTSVGGINRKITGTNAVSEIIPTPDHGRIMLTAPEAPEYWYQDYGTVRLEDGKAHVDLDPILASIIMVTEEYPVRVFCTPVDMLEFNGVAITNRTATGFDLVELNGGQHSGTIDYQLVVKPRTGFGEGRFPQAPGPAWLKPEHEPAAAQARNRPDPRAIHYWPTDWDTYGYDVAKATPVGMRVPAGPMAGQWKVAEGVFSDGIPAERP